MRTWKPFTESARASIVLAQEEAQRLADSDIHTRHLLLGILAQTESAEAHIFSRFGVTLEAVRTRAGKDILRVPVSGEMSFSTGAKNIIELAFAEAATLDDHQIGTEHIALSLLRNADGSAAEILTALNADRDAIRAEIIRRAKASLPATPAAPEKMATGRLSYQKSQLHESSVDSDAIVQMQRWLDEAYRSSLIEPNAMTLATVDSEGQPSARVVLLRALDAGGLVFYTSYLSRKAQELRHDSRAALLLYWPELERQIRVEGTVEQVGDEQSDAYFASRPRGHQLSAWASEQSEIVDGRELLEQRLQEFASRFEGEDVPRPHSWGGYVLRPMRVEFWQGRPNRLHDRLLYTRQAQSWQIVRLSP